MQHLRKQVDQIDSKLLRLLQKRTKLSGQIGQAKRRHGGEIYVPERERELLSRVFRWAEGKLPTRAITAIFREILSSSRAAQGQAPIGLLQEHAREILPFARWCFGACDHYVQKGSWAELARALGSGKIALALLTGGELARILSLPVSRKAFFRGCTVVGDFEAQTHPTTPLAGRVFIVTPHGKGAAIEADHLLILIECKSTENAVKSLLKAMTLPLTQIERLTSSDSPAGQEIELMRLTLGRTTDGIKAASWFLSARQTSGLEAVILGIYSSSEGYGG